VFPGPGLWIQSTGELNLILITRIIASLWLKKWTQEKDAKRNSLKWSEAVGGLQGEFQCGNPVKTLQGRFGEYIF